MAYQQATLDQGFMDQSEVKLGKVADPTVSKLRGFAASSTGQIGFFYESDIVATRNRIQGYTCPHLEEAPYRKLKSVH